MDTNFKSGKHLYGRGWLGLIPLVGGFVGIGLIILGIFKYRDKKLILIGTAALLFTVVIYSSLFYMTAFSDTVGRGTEKISEKYLNSLVKNIEYYKLKNGTYPESLEQLLSNDDVVQIYDPLLTRRPGTKEKKFYYKKTEDSYILFSSGLDRIPNTKDDIYPTESLNHNSQSDTSKP